MMKFILLLCLLCLQGVLAQSQNSTVEYEYESVQTAPPTMHSTKFCKRACLNAQMDMGPLVLEKTCKKYLKNPKTFVLIPGCGCGEFKFRCSAWFG